MLYSSFIIIIIPYSPQWGIRPLTALLPIPTIVFKYWNLALSWKILQDRSYIIFFYFCGLRFWKNLLSHKEYFTFSSNYVPFLFCLRGIWYPSAHVRQFDLLKGRFLKRLKTKVTLSLKLSCLEGKRKKKNERRMGGRISETFYSCRCQCMLKECKA